MIDGKPLNISGSRVELTDDGRVIVDGKPFEGQDKKIESLIEVKITGNVNLLVAEVSNVTIHGSVHEVSSMNGSLICDRVCGNVNTKNDNVICHHIEGDCTTTNRNIIR